MKMRSAFIELLHKDGRTEINKGTQRHIFVAFSPELTQSYSQRILLPIAAHRHSACHVQRLTVQHIYCKNTVQTVQSATELYLQ